MKVLFLVFMLVFSGCSHCFGPTITPPFPPTPAEIIGPTAQVDAPTALERGIRARAINDIQSNIIHFDYNESLLTPHSRRALQNMFVVFQRAEGLTFVVEGHCDERGAGDYNIALGEARARAVARYLIDLGVNPAQLMAVSYGEERPVCDVHAESCWRLNRRAQMVNR